MTLLVVDDNRSVLAAVKLLAEMKFDRVVTSTSPSRIPALLREEQPDCVLLDMNFASPVTNGNEGLYWLSEIRRLSPSTPVVLFTAYADVPLAVQGLKEGAIDFVSKPWDNARLLQTLIHAVRSNPADTSTDNTHSPMPTSRQSDGNEIRNNADIPAPYASQPYSKTPPTLEEMERRMIAEAIADNGGNLTAAATQLGITRQTLYNKIKRHNLN